MQTEINSRYHLGLDGFVFGLVRFESYFDDEMKLFRKKSVEMNFDKAKENFLASWPNDSRRQYIVVFFENPTELILQELGKLKAWRELGYNSFGYPDDFCPFEDDMPEEEIDLAKIVREANQNIGNSIELALKSEDYHQNEKPSDKERSKLECTDESDVRILILHKFMENRKIIDKIPEAFFIAHFRGHEVEPKINFKTSLRFLVRLLDGLYFMMAPNSYTCIKNHYSILSEPVMDHFLLKGKPLTNKYIYKTRNNHKGKNSIHDISYLCYEQIIDELKNTKQQNDVCTENQNTTKKHK